MDPRTYNIEGFTITIFGDWTKPVPIVYIHTFQHEGQSIWQECQRLGVQQFYLVEIEGNDWNRDLSPWPAKSMFPDESDFEGKALEWTQILTNKITQQVEGNLQITQRIIAGYSLAGLYALWCTYNTAIFDAAISCSASFWYPDFMDYVRRSEFPRKPLSIYLSIGDRESKVKNPIMQQTEPNTRLLCDLYSEMGIATIFELNNGNHFQKTDWRVAKGIQWTLRTLKKIQ